MTAIHSSEILNAGANSESESSTAMMKSTLWDGTNTSGVVRELERWNFSMS